MSNLQDLIPSSFLEPRQVLDHGFVRLVDTMPRLVPEGETADHAIVRAARVSYQGGTKTSRTDRGLIRYLMRKRHTSPFEMVELKFHVKLPIFVARQWVRHRTASINEVSARYSVLPEEFYVPEDQHLRPQSSTNKQGRATEPFSEEEAEQFSWDITQVNWRSYKTYDGFVKKGLARETARGVLNVNIYTEWYWKVNLLNLLKFLQLRMDPHAQYEIRVYADAIARMVVELAPWTFEAFQDYWQHAETLSLQEAAALKAILSPELREQWVARVVEVGAASARELDEFRRKWCAPSPFDGAKDDDSGS